MKRLLPHPWLTASLLLIWLLLNNSFSLGHIVLGAILAVFIPWLTQSFFPEHISIRKPRVLLRFLGIVLWDILIANVIVAKRILGSPDRLQPGFMIVPLDSRSAITISLLANTISLTPGTVSCDLSADQTSLLVHALHLDDAAAEVAQIKNRYEAPLKEVFG
ncbi:MAG TPA: Na+/H+ antiporter subunit E [bacterium]|nr:Na+/H+ antiporter subunit E [bacterium]